MHGNAAPNMDTLRLALGAIDGADAYPEMFESSWAAQPDWFDDPMLED